MAIWKDKENAAYFYNPSIDYKSDVSCILGPMSITCQFCNAMKFKDETLGLCCSDSNTEQAEQRCKIVKQVKQALVLKLQDMLQRNNSYIKSFKSAIEKLGPDFRIIIHADKVPAGEHSRRFNEPITSEVAVIMAGDQHGKRDIILGTRNSSIQKIADPHMLCDALQYPLLFWQGEYRYYFQLRQRNPSTGAFTERKVTAFTERKVTAFTERKVTAMDFYFIQNHVSCFQSQHHIALLLSFPAVYC
ncbi:helitron_like_N domain-containing protein [Trichonephila clavata]|uniref:Helitron_like_N domain-containing protein n=1 Tax=Trichonephila clavata TaxID=2740835 RepID=A0A8X6LW09_TRICU|nr:helitron_like_N domain-containing protein [Trichonephila clavata]